jgi:hypothetical protein
MANDVQITFDAAEPATLAGFWARAMGYRPEPPPPDFDSWDAFADAQGMPPEARGDFAAVIDPDGGGPRLFFQRVPEPKSAKNRVHLDVVAPGGEGEDRRAAIEAHVADLVAAGASRLAEHEQFGQWWVVLADPEGNEFCVV